MCTKCYRYTSLESQKIGLYITFWHEVTPAGLQRMMLISISHNPKAGNGLCLRRLSDSSLFFFFSLFLFLFSRVRYFLLWKASIVMRFFYPSVSLLILVCSPCLLLLENHIKKFPFFHQLKVIDEIEKERRNKFSMLNLQ